MPPQSWYLQKTNNQGKSHSPAHRLRRIKDLCPRHLGQFCLKGCDLVFMIELVCDNLSLFFSGEGCDAVDAIRAAHSGPRNTD